MKRILGVIIALIICTGCKDEQSSSSQSEENRLSILYIVGSSTMELMNDEFIHQSKYYNNIRVLNFAQSGEKLYTNCLRIGALPGNVKFSNNVLEVDKNNYLTTDWPLDLAMRPFEVNINNIDGSLHVDHQGYYFKPHQNHQIKYLDLEVFYPIVSKFKIEEDSIFILNLGKNDLLSNNDNSNLYSQFSSCIDFIEKNYSDKVYLINHFSTTDADKNLISDIEKLNGYMYNALPSQYLDLNKYIASKNIWNDSRITPIQEDLENQLNSKLPPSLSRDNIHLNNQTNTVIVNKIYKDLIKFKWIEQKN